MRKKSINHKLYTHNNLRFEDFTLITLIDYNNLDKTEDKTHFLILFINHDCSKIHLL